MPQTLSGIELIFTNNLRTPMFDTVQSMNDGVKTIEIDPNLILTRIDMKCWSDEIYGLRLVTEDLRYVVDEVWNTRQGKEHVGRWFSHRIPPDHEIIGVECNKESNEYSITRIGFLLWPLNSAVDRKLGKFAV